MSLTERPVNEALKTLLVNNEPFQYAHLVKFERPSRPDALSGLTSTAKQRYTYLTDASINVSFDDGSTDLQGISNGTQVYLANKLFSVGAIQEQTKATASQTSIVVDGNALGAEISFNATIASTGTDQWDLTLQAPINTDDVLLEGFREGDKVLVNGTPVNVHSFRAGNVLRVSKIDNNLSTTATPTAVTMKLSSEEIISILLNKNDTEYASFINREVYIYRAYFKDGQLVGTPIALFKGIIYNVAFADTEGDIKVTWGLTSHWGDFAQVKGRITSDTFHRALDENGRPQVDSALKPIYAYDKGFNHAESSINMLAKYTVMVEKQDVKFKKGFLGIGAKVKVRTYQVPEDRTTNLDFQINAKAIPLVYGVRKLDGIYVFADTLNSDSSEVYVVAALCEGEIGGLYDLYIEGNSLICNDKADFDARSSQTPDQTVEVICRGRADRGDALGGNVATTTPYLYYNSDIAAYSIGDPYLGNYIFDWYSLGYGIPIEPAYNTYGIVDGESISLTSPQNITIDFFSGKTGQKASAQLSQIAFQKNFKIQNAYWSGSDTSEYWGPNHRLADTAYVVGKVKIAEGETSVPEVSYVVRGKVIDCYNYDYSYKHDDKVIGESADNFVLGQTVTLYNEADQVINSTVQIIDKWSFRNPDGTIQWRFRFSSTPSLNYGVDGRPSVKRFYMKSGSNKWTMTTFNYDVLPSTNIPGVIASPITGLNNAGGLLTVNYSSNPYMAVENDPVEASASFMIVKSDYSHIDGTSIANTLLVGSASATSLASKYPWLTASAELSSVPGDAILASKNTVRLPSSASAADGYYNGDIIEIVRYNSLTGKSLVQTAEIVGYNGTNRVATIDGMFDFIPLSSDKVRIYPKWADARVSINPAIQTLDYVTSKTYGKGLDIVRDINLPSWTLAARKCDTRSDVTVRASSSVSTVGAGAVYRYPATGNIVWQGTVLETHDDSYIRFTGDLPYDGPMGKLTNKWNNWKSWKVGDVIYNSNYKLYTVTANGVIAIEPTHTSGTVNNAQVLSAITLTKVSGTGPSTVTLADSSYGNPVQSIRNSQKISGYSLYDADDINYWRYSGWDSHDQRSVTKNQCNIQIDTAQPLFDNVNALLEHYNGIMRYTAGQYYLDVEETAGTIALSDIRTITADDIIGKIQLSDEGTRSAFNSLTAAFADPANKYEARNISFFNSDYLKADRNVPKKGNLSIPGITNYYNTRLLADGFLNKSRFGLSINLTVRSHGILMLAGTIIQIVYPRYDWTGTGKKFRIESINYQPDGTADIVAKEYDDSFYSLSNIKGSTGTGPTVNTPRNAMGSPTNLIVTSADSEDELLNGVELFWDNDPNANSSNVYTEVYGSLCPNLFVEVTSISGSTLTTSSAPELVPGMPIYPQDSSNGISSDTIYYVVEIDIDGVPNTFSMSATKNSEVGDTFTSGTGLSLNIRTATLLATVPVPIRSYVDTVVNDGTGRVEKYYWVRHKVNQV